MNVPSFISREAELARLHDVIASAAAGRPRTVVIGGDAGVGKTRLLREALSGADARVLSGGCVDVAEDSLPYAPFAEALRGLADELEPDSEGAPLSATAQARMYERLLGLLRRLGEDAPVVLALEDLHWADRSTRDLLRFLAGNLRTERLAIFATYRADDLHRGHPLRTLLAELERGGAAERLHLRPFTRAEVADQMAALLGDPPAPAFVTEVFERAEGNAFCVEQLVATSLEDGGRRLPILLEDILHARFARLSAPAERLLGVVAAGGPRVREALIAAVCGLDDGERDESLRSAVDHQILAVEGDTYVFRHALLREAAYGTLLPGERHRLHAAYGAALEARPELTGDGALHAELARHWHAAGAPGPALAASVAAAAAAERRHGFAEASAHYARALEVWDRVDGPATAAELTRVGLLRRAAEVANLAGESARAASLIRTALEEIDLDLVPDVAGELHERLGRYLWAAGDSEAATGAYEHAVRLVPAEPPSRARARVLAAWGQAQMLLARYEASRASCEDAIAIARSVGARAEEGHALNTLGVDLACLGRPDAAVEHLSAARAIAEEVGDLDDLARAYLNLAEILAAPLDRTDEAVRVAREGVALCEAVGLDADYGVSLRAIAAATLFETGRWDEAEALVAEASERSPIECAAIDLHLAGAKVSIGRGAFDAADRHLAAVGELMTNTRDPQYMGPLAARTAELALWRRRPHDALAAALDGLERVDDCWYAAPLVWLGIRAAADLGDAETGRRLLARVSEGGSPVLSAYAATLRRRGDAARARGGRRGVRRPPRRRGSGCGARTRRPTAACARPRRCSSSAIAAPRRAPSRSGSRRPASCARSRCWRRWTCSRSAAGSRSRRGRRTRRPPRPPA